jgi:hypothetical protein
MAKDLPAGLFLLSRSRWAVFGMLRVHILAAPVEKLSGFRRNAFVHWCVHRGNLFSFFVIGVFFFTGYVD